MIEGVVLASITQLSLIRAFLTEALKTGEVLNSDGDRAMVRQIAFQLLSVENSLQAALAPPVPTAPTHEAQETREPKEPEPKELEPEPPLEGFISLPK